MWTDPLQPFFTGFAAGEEGKLIESWGNKVMLAGVFPAGKKVDAVTGDRQVEPPNQQPVQ